MHNIVKEFIVTPFTEIISFKNIELIVTDAVEYNTYQNKRNAVNRVATRESMNKAKLNKQSRTIQTKPKKIVRVN